MKSIESKLRRDGVSWRRGIDNATSRSEPFRANIPPSKIWALPLSIAAVLAVATLVSISALNIGNAGGSGREAQRGANYPTSPLPSGTLSGSVDPQSTAPTPGPAQALQRLSGDELSGMTSIPWSFVGIDTNDTIITITWTNGGCIRVAYALTETTSDVLITLLSAPASLPSGVICASHTFIGVGTIELPDPLGDRKLLHATISG